MTTFLPCAGLAFEGAVRHARTLSARLADNVDHKPNGFYAAAEIRCFITPDGCSGYALRTFGQEIELLSVWSTVKGRGDAIVADAVARGATFLGCYAGHLSTLYGRHGFTVATRTPNYTPGGPDVLDMVRPVSVSAPIGDHAANAASWAIAERVTA